MDNSLQMDVVEGKKPSVFKRILLVLLITAMLLGGTVYMAGFILFKGPSVYAGHEFIRAVQGHSVLRVLPRLYMTNAEIEAVLSAEDAEKQFSVVFEAE